MRKRTCCRLTALGLMMGFLAMSLAAPAPAAPVAAPEAGARLEGVLAPPWLQALLSWLDRNLTLERQPTKPSTYAATQESGNATNPGTPGLDVTPQAGPNLDPDG